MLVIFFFIFKDILFGDFYADKSYLTTIEVSNPFISYNHATLIGTLVIYAILNGFTVESADCMNVDLIYLINKSENGHSGHNEDLQHTLCEKLTF